MSKRQAAYILAAAIVLAIIGMAVDARAKVRIIEIEQPPVPVEKPVRITDIINQLYEEGKIPVPAEKPKQ